MTQCTAVAHSPNFSRSAKN